MKKFLSFAAFIAAFAMFTSCGDDEPATPVHHEFTNVTAFCEALEGIAKLNLDATGSKATITLSCANMPYEFPVSYSNLKIASTSETSGNISGQFNGSYDTKDNFLSVRGTVNGKNLIIFTRPLYSTLAKGTDYATTAEKYYRFDLLGTADGYIYIHNVKFVEEMPAQKCIRIPYRAGVGLTGIRPWGYLAKLDEVTPEFLNGNTWVPMESRNITNLEMNVNVVEKTFNISFTCFGKNYSDNGTLRM